MGYHKLWWVGIGHAGTLISAVLLLFRQRWRMAINRSAEAMTIFLLFKRVYFQLHMGRPWLAYWVLPIPNQFGSLCLIHLCCGMYFDIYLFICFTSFTGCCLILQC
jgi:hypothetical protein